MNGPSQTSRPEEAVLADWRNALQAAEALMAEGRMEESFTKLQLLLSAAVLPAAVLNNAGLLLQRLNRVGEADLAFQRAFLSAPLQEAPLVNRGALLRSTGRFQEAMETLLKAIEINPKSSVGWNNIGMLLKDAKRLPASIRAFQMAVAAAPDWALAHRNLGTVLSESGDARSALKAFEQAVKLAPEDPYTFSNLLLCLSYLPEAFPGGTVEAHLEYGKCFEKPVPKGWTNSRNPDRTLNVGFVSGDFTDHSVAWFFEPLLQSLQGSELKCFCFSNSTASGMVTDRLRKVSEGWVEIWGRDDETADRLVREHGIDVLVDLSGHTAANRLPLFARKPAPIQATAIGYLQTSGLKAMDYRFTDRWLDPLDKDAALVGTESLLRLNGGAFGFRIPTDAPDIAPLPSLDAGVVFGSFNNLSKLQPETARVWADVLRSTPGSRLVVVATDVEALRSQLVSQGIASERIQHSARLPLAELYKLLQGIHFALDTFPFNGLTVNLIAAWMGVPTVTMAGDTPHARAGLAVAERLGLPELVCRDAKEYVEVCLDLARNAEQLSLMRASLRERVGLGFGDQSLHAREFTDAVRSAWKHWCER